jgi:8-oxo-dGTP pyrophosphatase MutT (NUDIX family)
MINAKPTDAATVMILRPGQDAGVTDIEVLLVLRNRKSSFVPGYYVFPGGSLDAEDFEPGMECFVRGIDRTCAARMLSDMSQPEKALGAWVAGIRETFEEVGLLIACRSDGTPVMLRTDEEQKRFEKYRRDLATGKLKFSQMLQAEELILPADSLHYFSHWITPESFPQRYDVRFFLAAAPAAQSVLCDGVELTDSIWLTPSAALKRYEAGGIEMALPQIMTLEELSRFQTIEGAVAFAQTRHVPTVLTRIENIDGKAVEVMPDGTVFVIRPPVYP